MTHTKYPRRTLALAFAVALLAIAGPRALTAQTLTHGDVNGDGVVSALDAQAILTAVVSLPLPTGFVAANGDANCDNTTTALDAQIVLSHVIGLNVTQYCVAQTFGPGAITVTLAPTDTSVLLNRGLQFRAILKDSAGFLIQRPIAWTTSNADLVSIDSARGDTAWVGNHGVAYDAVATITATADGVVKSTTVKVVRNYAGIVIQPQRGDTIFQLNGYQTFNARMRDSLGAFTSYPNGLWTVADTNIATVTSSAQNTVSVYAKTTGTTWVRVTNQSNPTDKDSVPVFVLLPPINSCTGEGGTLHSSVTYSTPQTWSAATNPHYVYGSVTFDSLSGLTIEPGALVCMGYSSSMYFRPHAQLSAIGTDAQPIRIQSLTPGSPWYQIQLGDNTSYVNTPLQDTSVFRNVFIEGGDNWYGSITGWEQHVVLMDSVWFRRSGYSAVQLLAQGSHLRRSRIDTVSTYNTGGYGVHIGRGTVDSVEIRTGPSAYAAVSLEDSGAVRNTDIVGGQRGIYLDTYTDSAKIVGVSIAGTSKWALDLSSGSVLHSASGGVQIVSADSGGYRGEIGNFARLFPDSGSQQTLLNATIDTLEITGGEIQHDTLVARIDLPWRVTSYVYVGAGALLRAQPGAHLTFAYGGLYMQDGGRLQARGTSAQPVKFDRYGASSFYGLYFGNGPGSQVDTSQLSNVRVSDASGICGYWACAAVSGYDRHVVLIDSTTVNRSSDGGISLDAPGSRISVTTIDTTQTGAYYAALTITGRTDVDSVVIRNSGKVGLRVAGSLSDSVRLRRVHILGALDAGIVADGARILGDSASVFVTGAPYPFRGHFDSFAALARSAAAQANFYGNTDSVVVIVGRSDRPFRGRHPGLVDTVFATPTMRWQVESGAYVDTMATFAPQPGARISFTYGGLYFVHGGTLNAIGTAADSIDFYPLDHNGGQTFWGLKFENPGAQGGTLPPPPPYATSFLNYVRLGEATNICGDLACSTLSTNDHHVVMMDHSRVRLAHGGGVALAARGSAIMRSRIDSTLSGSYAGLALGAGTVVDTVTVYGSFYAGVGVAGSITAAADTIVLRKLTIDSSGNVGLWAEGGRLIADSNSVKAIRNAYAFRGFIDNFAAIARGVEGQTNLLGNTDDAVVLVGRSDRTAMSRFTSTGQPDTITAIPQLRWQVEGTVYIDSLTALKPQPGARIQFNGGNLVFQRGATLQAYGTVTDTIRFTRVSPTSGTFNGIAFLNRGSSDTVTSVIRNTFFGQSNGQCQALGCATLSPNDRHVLMLDSVRVSQATAGAIYLATRGSRVFRSVIDTTTSGSYAALALNPGTLAENTVVRRAGQTGVYLGGTIGAVADTMRLRGVQILNSVGVGLHAEAGRLLGDSGSVTITGNAYAFRGYIDNFAAIARDSTSQAMMLGNVDDAAVIVGRSDRTAMSRFISTAGPDSLTAIPQLRWQVEGQAFIDSLVAFAPKPGARIQFNGGSLVFQKGGHLLAYGTPSNRIRFERVGPSGTFNGLAFGNRGATSVDTSVIQNTFFGQSNSQCRALGCATISPDDRHVLLLDSVRVSQATGGAIYLAAKGSSVFRSVIDTTTSGSYAALALNPGTLAESTVVRRAGQTGVWLGGSITVVADTMRLRGVQILNSVGFGLQAEAGRLLSDPGTVIASGNAYPFRGFIDNFAAIAPDSVSQVKLLGNATDVAVIVGRTDRVFAGDPAINFAAPRMLTTIPQLRWQVESNAYIDTLASFVPRPGALLTFNNGGLMFQHGGTLNATGTVQDSITFRPITGANFYGLEFASPGAGTGPWPPSGPPMAASYLSFVKVDSASGQSIGGFSNSAVNADIRHQLFITDAHFRRNINSAIGLQAKGSSLTRIRIDTTGNQTTSYAAIQLEDSVYLTDVTVFRSGQYGIYTSGKGISFNNVLVQASVAEGLYIGSPSTGLYLERFTADSNGTSGVAIDADSVELRGCTSSRNGTTASHHGFRTVGGQRWVTIVNCDIVNNAGLGINNEYTNTDTTYYVVAMNNWWGDPDVATPGPGFDGVSAKVYYQPACSTTCNNPFFAPIGQGTTFPPMIPPQPVEQRSILASARRRRRRRRQG